MNSQLLNNAVYRRCEKLETLKIEQSRELNKYQNAKAAQGTIASLRDKLEDSDVRLKLIVEIRKLVKRVTLYNDIKKFVIEYEGKTKVKFDDYKIIVLDHIDERERMEESEL